MFKNYIFDLYGTLVDIYTCEDSADLWEKMTIYYGYQNAHYSPFELRQKYQELIDLEKLKSKKMFPKYTHVDINLTNIFRELYEYKGVSVSGDDARATARVFRCYSTDHIRLYNGVIDLLDTLKAKKKNIFLLSNAQHDFTVPEIQMLGLEKYFNDIVISSDVYCSKPDPHMYDILFKRHGLKKKDTVMIGNDCNSDIKSAYNYGIKSLYIHQAISSPITEKLLCDWKIMDGQVPKIKNLIID